MCVCVCVCVCIHREKEKRERERETLVAAFSSQLARTDANQNAAAAAGGGVEGTWSMMEGSWSAGWPGVPVAVHQ